MKLTPEDRNKYVAYVKRVEDLVRSIEHLIPEALLATVRELVWEESDLALCEAAWAIVNAKAQVPKATIDELFDLIKGSPEAEDLPPNLREFARG